MDERLDDQQLFLSYASTIPCADLAVPEVSRALPGDSAWNSPRGRGIAPSAAPRALFLAPSGYSPPGRNVIIGATVMEELAVLTESKFSSKDTR
jgi:hypothetical protein